jgi:hypothetical protein
MAKVGINDMHLLGKVLDVCDDEVLAAEGFTPYERTRAKHLFAVMDAKLNDSVGLDWDEREVL